MTVKRWSATFPLSLQAWFCHLDGMRGRDYYVYIMTGPTGVFYTGITNNLALRVAQHKAGLSEFTARFGLNRLVYFESTTDVREAIAREKEIKPWRREKKVALIKGMNPGLLDLGPRLTP
jgi:putative endonuclease